MMDAPLASFTSKSLADELQRTLSTTTLMWAVASVAVLLLAALRVDISYERALPVVVLLTWVAAEISARMPSRVPIAVCERCERIALLPATAWLRGLWPWRHCAFCGAHLHYRCAQNHLLSVFPNEKLDQSCFCTQCGTPVPQKLFSVEDFQKRLAELLQRMPKEEQSSFHVHNLKAVLAGVPMSVKPSDDYWGILRTLVERSPAFASITATDTLIAMIRKMQFQTWSDYRKVQDQLTLHKPSFADPCIALELVAAMLKDSGVEPDALSRIQTVVASTLKVAEQNQLKELFGDWNSSASSDQPSTTN